MILKNNTLYNKTNIPRPLSTNPKFTSTHPIQIPRANTLV